MRVLYVLPASGGSGGANSIVQESLGLVRLGVDVRIAVDGKNVGAFRRNYAALPLLQHLIVPFEKPQDLVPTLVDTDVVVATVFPTVAAIVDAVSKLGVKSPSIAYYVQDYEPLFVEPGTDLHSAALRSYEFGGRVHCFAKTDWLCQVVKRNHSAIVAKVSPSLDHDVYFPSEIAERGPLVVSAMVRPTTPRRAPHRTIRVLKKLLAQHRDAIRPIVFGATTEELRHADLDLGSIRNEGRLTREQVAQVLRESRLFLDLSDFQAFGRTGLEAMACGSVPILPMFGGAYEFAEHTQNSYLVDPRSDDAILDAVANFVALSPRGRKEMRIKALRTAAEFSVHKASVSVYDFFASIAN